MAGALTYVTLNLVSSALFLAGVGLMYGITRSLNMAELHLRLAVVAESRPELVVALAGPFLVAFGIKAAVFPLYTWLPASYHTPPVAVSALLAGLLTKVGVYALIRILTLVFPPLPGVPTFLLGVAALTMIFGVLGAVAMFETRRILSFHIIRQIGYMVMGLALIGSPSPAVRAGGLAAPVLYVVHHIILKANLFLVAGIAARLGGSFQLKEVGGLATAAPWLALLFLIPAGSLAGVPPLSGFWAKLAVIRAGLEGGAWLAVTAALLAGLLTVLSMVKICTEGFWKPAPGETPPPAPLSRLRVGLLAAPSLALGALTLAIGLYPLPLWELSRRAAGQLDWRRTCPPQRDAHQPGAGLDEGCVPSLLEFGGEADAQGPRAPENGMVDQAAHLGAGRPVVNTTPSALPAAAVISTPRHWVVSASATPTEQARRSALRPSASPRARSGRNARVNRDNAPMGEVAGVSSGAARESGAAGASSTAISRSELPMRSMYPSTAPNETVSPGTARVGTEIRSPRTSVPLRAPRSSISTALPGHPQRGVATRHREVRHVDVAVGCRAEGQLTRLQRASQDPSTEPHDEAKRHPNSIPPPAGSPLRARDTTGMLGWVSPAPAGRGSCGSDGPARVVSPLAGIRRCAAVRCVGARGDPRASRAASG